MKELGDEGAGGDVLRDTMESYPDKRMTVLCGHTHGGGVIQVSPNLKVITGEAEYRHPDVQRVFEF